MVPKRKDEFSLTNASNQEIMQVLDKRLQYFEDQKKSFEDGQKSVETMMSSADNGERVTDDLGRRRPKSLTVFGEQQKLRAGLFEARATKNVDEINRLVRDEINPHAQGTGIALLPKGRDALRDALEDKAGGSGYADSLKNVQFPDSDEGRLAQTKILYVTHHLLDLGYCLLNWIEAEETVETLDEEVIGSNGILPKTKGFLSRGTLLSEHKRVNFMKSKVVLIRAKEWLLSGHQVPVKPL